MKQFAVIGLGPFGQRVADEFSSLGVEFLVVDRDRELIERYKTKASVAYCLDALSRPNIEKVIPETIDAAVIDLGKHMEASILVTSYLKKIGIRQILVKAESDEHAEVLQLVGATRIVFPDREAARKITPLLVSASLFSFLPLSRGLAIAEVQVPPALIGKTLSEADVRKRHGVNIVASRTEQTGDYEFTPVEYRFQPGDILVVTGPEEKVAAFSGIASSVGRKTMKTFLTRLASG
jgi:trk system potassium uptake protein TrkA